MTGETILYPEQATDGNLVSAALRATGYLSQTTGSGADPSRDRHPRSARDAGSSNEGLPRCRVGGPSTSDTERPDPTQSPGAGCRPPRAEGLQRQYYPPVARLCGQ